MKTISAVIIAKNEGERIAECIESLSFCNEIHVIDNNSTDGTAVVAGKMGAKVHSYQNKSFAELRNYGLKLVKTDWILYVDADERVSEDLGKEIHETIQGNSSFSAFRLRRVNFYLGNTEWPKQEFLERLFKTERLKKWVGELHESPEVDGEISTLSNPLHHFTHRTLSEMVAKTLEWSQVEAKLRFDQGHPRVVWWRFPRVMLTGFFNSYITQGGWKVGTVGLIESIYQAFSMFITYARLWELQHEAKHHATSKKNSYQ